MAHSINKVIIIGNLGRTPELRYTPAGKPVTTLSVATSSSYKNRQTGDWETEKQWHRVIVLGQAAEWAGKKLTTGDTVHLEGSLKYGSYTNKEGVRIPTTEIVAYQVESFGPKKSPASQEQDPQEPDGQQGQSTPDTWLDEYNQAPYR